MNRRGMIFTSIFGALFGLAKTVQAKPPKSVPTEYGFKGESVAQAYRRDANGEYRLIKRSDLKPGDQFIMIGVENDRLWTVASYIVGERGFFIRANGTQSVSVKDSASPVLL